MKMYDYVYGYFLLKGMITASYEAMKDSFDAYHTGKRDAYAELKNALKTYEEELGQAKKLIITREEI